MLFVFGMTIFFAPSCEKDEADSNIIFSITDNDYFNQDYIVVLLHDAANPTDEPLMGGLLEPGGTLEFTKDSLEVNASDIDKLIITTCEWDDNGDYYTNYDCTSNWFIEKGAVWKMFGSSYEEGDEFYVDAPSTHAKRLRKLELTPSEEEILDQITKLHRETNHFWGR